MLTHEDDMSVEEVVAHYTESRERGDRLFLIEQDGVLVGDADFRHFDSESAEYAIMIGARNLQAGDWAGSSPPCCTRGLCARWPCACVRDHPAANRASIRLFEQLGYGPDQSLRARSLIDEESDVTLSVERLAFEKQHGATMDGVRFAVRKRWEASMNLPPELQWLDGRGRVCRGVRHGRRLHYLNERRLPHLRQGRRAARWWAAASSTVHPEPARSRLLEMLAHPGREQLHSREGRKEKACPSDAFLS